MLPTPIDSLMCVRVRVCSCVLRVPCLCACVCSRGCVRVILQSVRVSLFPGRRRAREACAELPIHCFPFTAAHCILYTSSVSSICVIVLLWIASLVSSRIFVDCYDSNRTGLWKDATGWTRRIIKLRAMTMQYHPLANPSGLSLILIF